jgi:hypothetical protein
MTEPRRLVEDGTEFERSILASARLDVAGDESLKRVLVAIGAGAVTLSATASTAGAGAAAGGSAGAAAGGALLGGFGAGAVVKWIGVGAVCVGAAVTAASLARDRPAPVNPHLLVRSSLEPASAPPPEIASSRAGQEPRPGAESSSLDPVPRFAPVAEARKVGDSARSLPAAPPLGASTAAQSRSTPEAVPLPSILGAEVSALDRVRASLAAHDAAGALRALDAYDRTFPHSVLAEEATVLRVDAFVQSGDRTAAEALGRHFLLIHPASPHASHLRQLLDAHN